MLRRFACTRLVDVEAGQSEACSAAAISLADLISSTSPVKFTWNCAHSSLEYAVYFIRITVLMSIMILQRYQVLYLSINLQTGRFMLISAAHSLQT
jgi:hypothetical protein